MMAVGLKIWSPPSMKSGPIKIDGFNVSHVDLYGSDVPRLEAGIN